MHRMARCPVCKAEIGKIYPGEITMVFCKECDTEFTFYPGDPRPSSKVHPKKSQCNCIHCRPPEEDRTTKYNPPVDDEEDDYWTT